MPYLSSSFEFASHAMRWFRFRWRSVAGASDQRFTSVPFACLAAPDDVVELKSSNRIAAVFIGYSFMF